MQINKFDTYREIITQTTAWKDAINEVERNKDSIKELINNHYEKILIIGCGSTYYLSQTAASIIQLKTEFTAQAFPSSELLLFPKYYQGKGKKLLIAISRSGTTSETLEAVKLFKENNCGDVIVITNYESSPLALLGDIKISIQEGKEKGIAQTRSFSSMLLAVFSLVEILNNEKKLNWNWDTLVNDGNQLINKYKTSTEKLSYESKYKQVFFLGSGAFYGLACEASLKLKEMSQTTTEPFHFLEFRHGPISMIDEKTLVIGLISEKSREYELEVIKDIQSYGGKTLTIGNKGTNIQLNSEVPDYLRGVLFMPFLQLFAFYRAVQNGKNPDFPNHLKSVVELQI